MNTELDQLLSTPLPTVKDNGFSEQVSLRIAAYENKRKHILWAIYLLMAIIFAGFFPIGEWLANVNQAYNTTIQAIAQVISHVSLATAKTQNEQNAMVAQTIPYLFSLPLVLIAYWFMRLED